MMATDGVLDRDHKGAGRHFISYVAVETEDASAKPRLRSPVSAARVVCGSHPVATRPVPETILDTAKSLQAQGLV